MIQLGQKLQNGQYVYFLILEPKELDTIQEEGENGQITISLGKLIPELPLDLVITYTPDLPKLEEILKAATRVTWPELFGHLDRCKREFKPLHRSHDEVFQGEPITHQLGNNKPVKQKSKSRKPN